MPITFEYVLFHLHIQVLFHYVFSYYLLLLTSYVSYFQCFPFQIFFSGTEDLGNKLPKSIALLSTIFWFWLYINQCKRNFVQWEASCPCNGLRMPFCLAILWERRIPSLPFSAGHCGQNVCSLRILTTRWQWWAKRDNCFTFGSVSETNVQNQGG